MRIGLLSRNKRCELAFSTIVIAIVALAVLGILLYFVIKGGRIGGGTTGIDPTKLEFLKEQCKQKCTLTKSVDSLDEFERSEYCIFSKTEDLDNDNQIEDTEKELKCWGLIGERCTATLVAKVNYCVPSAIAPSDFNPPNEFEIDATTKLPKALEPEPRGCKFNSGGCEIHNANCGDYNGFGEDVCKSFGCTWNSGVGACEGNFAVLRVCDEISRNVEVSISEEKCPGYGAGP